MLKVVKGWKECESNAITLGNYLGDPWEKTEGTDWVFSRLS